MKNMLHWKDTAMPSWYAVSLSRIQGFQLIASFFILFSFTHNTVAQTCMADAGTLDSATMSSCIQDGTPITIQASPDGNASVPSGFSTLFVLTSGETLVIEAVSATPQFTIDKIGLYTIHTLIYDENTLDLGVVNFGTTTGGDVLAIVAANNLCASLDVIGAPIEVFDCDCPGLSCYAQINVSLSAACIAEVTVPMGSPSIDPDHIDNYTLELSIHGKVLSSTTLTGEHLGEHIEFKITDRNPECANSCWGNLIVEDKLKPVINCQLSPIELDCIEMVDYTGPGVTQSCGMETIVVMDETIELLACDPDFIKKITLTYGAKDDSGNMADTCRQEFLVKRLPSYDQDSTAYTRATNYLVRLDNAFTCDTIAPVSVAGQPLFRGKTFQEVLENYCSVYTEMIETNVITSDCKDVILRKWGLYDLTCRGTDTLYYQIQLIEFYDDIAPVVKYQNPDYTESTSGHDCSAFVHIPPIHFYDNCTEVKVDVVYPYGFISDFNAEEGEYVDLPVGIDTIIYRGIDLCGNIGTDTLVITVEDRTPPVAICEDKLAVSLTTDGISVVPVEVIDEGSHDDCKLASLQIKKMEVDLCGFGQDTIFSDKVTFCCEDLSNEASLVPVILRATDKAGQFNDCMVRVEIQDPGVIRVVGLPHIKVSCHYPFDPADLSVFGSVVPHDSLREVIAIDDSLFVVDGIALDGYYSGTCSAELTDEIYSDDRNQCGVGTVIRLITIRTEARVEYVKQSITFKDYKPFHINRYDPEDEEDDIIWPKDVYGVTEAGSCDASAYDPDNLPDDQKEPVILSKGCDLIAVSITDEQFFSFEFGTDACFKILREWTVIDWCKPTDTNGPNTWTYVQTIKVSNKVAPIVQCSDIEVMSADPECGPVDVNISASATDDCSRGIGLRYYYQIDYHNDGSKDQKGQGNDVIEIFPIGKHMVYWTAEDKCGNVSEACEQMVSIVNTKAPLAYCVLGVVTDLVNMDTDGDGIHDTPMSIATPHNIHGNKKDSLDCVGELLKFSFSSDTTDIIREFNCNTTGDQIVRLYVTDSFGNQSFCETTIEVQDNNDLCGDCIEPTAVCQDNLEIIIDANGRAPLSAVDLYAGNRMTDCAGRPLIFTFGANSTLDMLNYSCRNIGIQSLNLFVTDADGNATSCSADVTVTDPNNICDDDCVDPVAVCRQNINLNLTADGLATLSFAEVFSGNTLVDCQGRALIFSFRSDAVQRNLVYDCDDIGTTTVTLYVTDGAGIQTSCTASVTITDTDNVCDGDCIEPTAVCNQNLLLNINTNNMASINVDEVYAGTQIIDCEGRPLQFSFLSNAVQENVTYDCSDVGTNTITLYVLRPDGTETSCRASLTITDSDDVCMNDCTDPIAACNQNISLNINANGSVTLAVNQLYAGSALVDCQGRSLIFSLRSDAVQNNETFTCDDIGTNTVSLFVTDGDGNITSCTATVTVTDTNRVCDDCIDPIAECTQNISLDITASGTVTLNIGAFYTGSSTVDCSDRPLLFSFRTDAVQRVLMFDCQDVGTNMINLFVTDADGNQSTCTASVTITDNNDRCQELCDDPIALCNQNILLNLDADGTTSIGVEEVNAGTEVTDCVGRPLLFSFNESTEESSQTFECSDVGTSTVTLFVIDADGNNTSCSATITISDDDGVCEEECVNPQAVCTAPQTINLDVNGMIIISASELYAGDHVVDCAGRPLIFSFDAEGNETELTLSCNNIGTQSISLFVTDSRGARTVCITSVTIADPNDFCTDCMEPVAMCDPNIIINIGVNGVVQLGAAEVYSGGRTTDCDGNPLSFSFSENTNNTSQTFNCSSVGDIRLSLFLTDNDGNQTTCNTVVTITDTDDVCDELCLNPEAICNPNFTANINDDGIISLNAIDLYGGNRMTDCDGNMLEFSFSENVNNNVQTIGCTQIGEQTVNLFVTTGDGSRTVCQTMITITDDNSVCCDNDLDLVCRDVSINVNFFDRDLNGVIDSSDVTLLVEEIIGAGTDLVECNGDSLFFSFSTDLSAVATVFGCGDLGAVTVDLFSTTSAGIVNSCQSMIIVTDIGDQCQPNATSSLSLMRGQIMTTQQSIIPDVEVSLRGSDEVSMTDSEGNYAFSNMPFGGQYIIKPSKTDLPVKGLSTLDILLIRNHIYGHNKLDSPYKLLAADVDQSESITAADIVEIKKMLLGLQDVFSNNDSWRFISEDNVFFDEEKPYWGLVKDQYPILEYNGFMDVDFTGIKIGDVNEDINMILSAEIRSQSFVYFESGTPLNTATNNQIKIPIRASESIEEVHGIQMSIGHEFHVATGIESAAIDILEEDYAVNVRQGMTTLSWIGEGPLSVAAGDVLFYILFDGTNYTKQIELDLDDSLLKNEVYTGPHLDISKIAMAENPSSVTAMNLFSYHPNPWIDHTTVSFEIGDIGDVEIEVFAMDGTRVYRHAASYVSGRHQKMIHQDDIPLAGVYVIQLSHQGQVERQKMLVIK